MGDFRDESSSVSQNRSSNTDYRSAEDEEEEEEEEESSWTTYIVDFLINGQEKINPSSPLSRETALSAVVSGEPGFKRRKNKGSSVHRVDDALEDTASSPIHTHKLMPKMEDHINPSRMVMDKEISSGNEEVVGSGRGGGDSRLLKERGLCLVPLSMVVNYLG